MFSIIPLDFLARQLYHSGNNDKCCPILFHFWPCVNNARIKNITLVFYNFLRNVFHVSIVSMISVLGLHFLIL